MTVLALGLLVLAAAFAAVVIRDELRRRQRLNRRMLTRLGEETTAADDKGREFLRTEEGKAALIALAAMIVAGVMTSSLSSFLLLAVPVVPAVWWLARKRRLAALREAFLKTFPEAVESFARAIKSGVPLERALEATGENYSGEVGHRFKGLVSDLALGVSFPHALARFSRDLDNADVDFFCQALSLSRETGSPLSPILATFCELIRERGRLDRRLRALTAESRASARILCAMPFFILGLQAFMNPGQLGMLVHDETGQMILFYAALSMLAGFAVINKMTRSLEA